MVFTTVVFFELASSLCHERMAREHSLLQALMDDSGIKLCHENRRFHFNWLWIKIGSICSIHDNPTLLVEWHILILWLQILRSEEEKTTLIILGIWNMKLYGSHNYDEAISLSFLSFLQIEQYSSFESLLIGVKQSLQYFMILWINLHILKMLKIKH